MDDSHLCRTSHYPCSYPWPEGRHEVTVSGEDRQGQLAWNANTCLLFQETVRVTGESVEIAGESIQQRYP